MELLYLWVEEYKNIKEQGFNFSPRFKCQYNPDTQKLTIDENENYVNIFPDNINITAIVGENGSGKSSLLEVLSSLHNNVYINHSNDTSFTIYQEKEQLYIYCDNIKNKKIKLEDFITIQNHTKFKTPDGFSAREHYKILYFSNCLTDMTNKKEFEGFRKTFNNFYQGFNPKRNFYIKNRINSANFEQKFTDILKNNIEFFNFIDKKLIFDNFRYEIPIATLQNYVNSDNLFEQELSFIKDNIEDKEKLFYRFLNVLLIIKTQSLIFNSQHSDFDQKRPKPMEDFFKKEVSDNIENFSNQDYNFEYYEKIKSICTNALNKIKEEDKLKNFLLSKEDIQNFLKKYSILKPIKKEINPYELTTEKKEVSYDKIFVSKKFSLDEKIELNDFLKELLSENILKINFFNSENIKQNFLSLSTGEEEYIKFLTNTAYSIKQLSRDEKCIILYDEIELSFHPNWQKKIISNLNTILYKLNQKNIHFIFTSHSPFLISDLPKENVIFLKDGKQEYPFKDKQTFGANIHTLLSDGFFMSDGLMGEFAKSKINEIINFHKEITGLQEENNSEELEAYKCVYEDKQKHFWHIHSIIGEEYLKQVIKNHLIEIEKILLGEDKAKEAEIQRLQAQIDALKGNQ